MDKNKIKIFAAFTLAEVLITLAIIGVVASITIPTVMKSYQKKMYVTRLKKSYSNLNSAFRTIMARDGVTRLSDTNLWSMLPSNSVGITESRINLPQNAAIKNEIMKVFNISKIYDGSAGNKLNGNGISYSGLNSNEEVVRYNYGTVLNDGSIIMLELHGTATMTAKCGYGSSAHDCGSLYEFRSKYGSKRKFWKCLGFVLVDVNGIKGPNKIGRDFFFFYISDEGTLYPEGGVEVATMLNNNEEILNNFLWAWDSTDDLFRCYMDGRSEGDGCAGRIMEEGWQMNY